MGSQAVNAFVRHIKESRDVLEQYNTALLESGSYMLPDSMMGDGLAPITTLPENPEDTLLQEIIQSDDRALGDEKTVEANKKTIISQFSEMMEDFMTNVIYGGTSPEKRMAQRRHRLFERLAQLGQEDGFDVSADDLEYYLGVEIRAMLKAQPDATPGQIIAALLNEFEGEE